MNFLKNKTTDITLRAPSDEVVVHSQVPFRKRPVYLRLVNTTARAKDYAAGGFHIAVDRMTSGGCGDAWEAHESGTKVYLCQQPKNRDDLRTLWETAALAYLNAYSAADLQTAIITLKMANAHADAAFRAEGIEPPRDPVLQTTDPVGPKSRPMLVIGGLAALAFGAAFLLGRVSDEHNPGEVKF